MIKFLPAKDGLRYFL